MPVQAKNVTPVVPNPPQFLPAAVTLGSDGKLRVGDLMGRATISGQDAAAADYMCSLCAGVITDVLESNCCGNLFCLSCVTNYFDAFPLVSTCPMCTDVSAHRWQHEWTHSEWVQRQIDTVAPKCEHCARNVLAADRDRHKTVCQKLNHPCTKCGGSAFATIVAISATFFVIITAFVCYCLRQGSDTPIEKKGLTAHDDLNRLSSLR